jgi:hypothetical protein
LDLVIRLVLALVLCAPALTSSAPDSKLAEKPPEIRTVETVAPGVEHIAIRRGAFAEKPETDRWTIHVLILDPRQVRLGLGRAMDEGVGTESVSSMAARHGALAAVNGGYFRTTGLYRGEPAGLLELSGRVLSEPSRKRPGLAVADVARVARAAVVAVDFRAAVVGESGATRAVDGVNRPRGEGELILFTPEFHRTTLTEPGGVEAVVVEGLVVALFDGEGSREIPANGYVISASGKAGQWLRNEVRAGMRFELKTSVTTTPDPDFAPEFVIGGGPILVRDGQPAATWDPGTYDAGFLEKRHPRTAAGVRADGTVVLVTVDGRHPASSVGMTIPEMSSLMIELGCVEALNLDGGGSTTMVVKGKVVNNPSDVSGERPVSDGLLVFVRPPAP